MNEQARGIGDNLPPTDADNLAEVINERLEDAYLADAVRAAELLSAVQRVPETIGDDDTNKRASDFVAQITKHVKTLNTHREAEKAPYLGGGRAVDGFFKTLTDPLAKAKQLVLARKTRYERQKADEERKRREEEERRAREEAERLAREAAEKLADAEAEGDLMDAIEADEAAAQAAADAERAHKAAEAKAAELSASRSDLGSHSSLRTIWTGVVEDYGKLDLEKLRPHIPRDALDRAVKAYAKLHKANDVEGARIYEDTQSVVR